MTTDTKRPTFRAMLVHGTGDDAAWTELAGLWPSETGESFSGRAKTGITTTAGMRLVILPVGQDTPAA